MTLLFNKYWPFRFQFLNEMATDIATAAAASSTQSVTAMSGPDQILDSESYVTTDINGSVKLRLGTEAPQVSLPYLLF